MKLSDRIKYLPNPYAETELDGCIEQAMSLESRIKELEAELARLKRDGCYPYPKARTFTDARGGNPRIPFP